MFHKTLNFCYCSINRMHVAKKFTSSEQTANNIKLLMDEFGFSHKEVTILAHKQGSVLQKDNADLKETYMYCKSLGFTHQEMIDHPLLSQHHLTHWNHYQSLKDTGCRVIKAHLLARTKRYFRNRVQLMKMDGYLEANDNVADNLMSHLVPSIPKPLELRRALKELDQMSWSEIHKILLTNWLKVRLNATDDDIIKLFRIHKMIQNKSFRVINENIKIVEELGFTNDKILKCGYILSNHPEYPKKVLKDHPYLSGIDMARQFRVNPKLMTVRPRNFREIYYLLKEHGIKDDQIRYKPEVFGISPTTLRYRMNVLQTTPEFKVLMTDPKVLKLIIHQTKILSRWDFLKSLNIKCASLTSIESVQGIDFDEYVGKGKDEHKTYTVIQWFCRLFNKDFKEVHQRLRRHPKFCNVPFVNIERTFKYLIGVGYSEEDIFQCLVLLLYPSKKIQPIRTNLEQVECFNLIPPHKQLHLILYHLEKNHGFNGNGIWLTNLPAVEESELEQKVLE